jgi:hypothetical protein
MPALITTGARGLEAGNRQLNDRADDNLEMPMKGGNWADRTCGSNASKRDAFLRACNVAMVELEVNRNVAPSTRVRDVRNVVLTARFAVELNLATSPPARDAFLDESAGMHAMSCAADIVLNLCMRKNRMHSSRTGVTRRRPRCGSMCN